MINLFLSTAPINILGRQSAAKCKEVEKVINVVVQESGSSAKVEKVTDFKEMMALGVMSTPAVIIDGTIMCTGRIPSKSEVMEWIH